MKRMWGTAIIIVAVSAAAGAQSGKEMDKPAMGDMRNMTYTGCVESVNHGGAYVLTHVAHDQQMMDHDGMKKDHMMPSSLALTGRSDLKKHVGHKVTVTGSVSKGSMDGEMKNDMETLAVTSLKVVGKSCK
jgi:hypothetical protein